MTNQMIILMERIRLMDEGIIGTTGRSVTIETDEGTKTLEEPEYIFTVSEWNKRGFRINKGEKHIAECMIWKKDKGSKKANPENPEDSEESEEVKAKGNGRKSGRRNGGFYLGKAYFLKASQVCKVAA